jgi:hypothetical protein
MSLSSLVVTVRIARFNCLLVLINSGIYINLSLTVQTACKYPPYGTVVTDWSS